MDIPALSARELTMIVKGGVGGGGEGASSDMKIFMSGASMRINGEPATVIFNKSVSAALCNTVELSLHVENNLQAVFVVFTRV